jgi:hypothetical protein
MLIKAFDLLCVYYKRSVCANEHRVLDFGLEMVEVGGKEEAVFVAVDVAIAAGCFDKEDVVE